MCDCRRTTAAAIRPVKSLATKARRASSVNSSHRLSAITYPIAPPYTPVTRTAQYFSSGILPNGSSAALVSRLAAAST